MVVAKAIDAKPGSSREEIANQYMPMFYIVGGTTLIFMICFFLLTRHDNPAEERERRRLRQIQREREHRLSSGKLLNKKEQLIALLSNPNYVFLLVITLFVGYGRQSLSILRYVCISLLIHRPIYTEEKILSDYTGTDKKTLVSICSLTVRMIHFFVK